MEIQLSQLGAIAEDHLEKTQDASKVKVTELHKSGDVGIVGGKFRPGKVMTKRFLVQISLEDGSILSEKILSAGDDLEDEVNELKKELTPGTATAGSNAPLAFNLGSAVSQLVMGASIALILVLILVIEEPTDYMTIVILAYGGIAIAGYFDMKMCREYELWNPFSPFWLVALLFPVINAFSAIAYMIRRWSVIYGGSP